MSPVGNDTSKYEAGERRLESDLIELRDIRQALGADLVDVVRRWENVS